MFFCLNKEFFVNRISLCVETGIAGKIEPDTVANEILSFFFSFFKTVFNKLTFCFLQLYFLDIL